jgi:cell division protein FtsL
MDHMPEDELRRVFTFTTFEKVLGRAAIAFVLLTVVVVVWGPR